MTVVCLLSQSAVAAIWQLPQPANLKRSHIEQPRPGHTHRHMKTCSQNNTCTHAGTIKEYLVKKHGSAAMEELLSAKNVKYNYCNRLEFHTKVDGLSFESGSS